MEIFFAILSAIIDKVASSITILCWVYICLPSVKLNFVTEKRIGHKESQNRSQLSPKQFFKAIANSKLKEPFNLMGWSSFADTAHIHRNAQSPNTGPGSPFEQITKKKSKKKL
jgi:hypothetical protein